MSVSTKRSRKKGESAAVMAQLLREKQCEEKMTKTLNALPAGAPLPVVVSGLTKAYVPFVDHLHRKALPIEYGDAFYCSALRSAPWAKVALWEGCVVGAAICMVSDESVGSIHIRTLVSKVARRRIASQLLETVFAEASELGFWKSSLCVHVKNTGAIAFYMSLGYEVKETRIDYYSKSKDKLEAPPDAFLMVRELGPAPFESWNLPSSSAGQGPLPSSTSAAEARHDIKIIDLEGAIGVGTSDSSASHKRCRGISFGTAPDAVAVDVVPVVVQWLP